MNESGRNGINGRLRRRLGMLGIPPHMCGYLYVASAIEKWTPGAYIHKEIYPEVAKEHGTNVQAVEKSIRYAIKNAWEKGRGNTGVIVETFGVWALVSTPNASEFIATLGGWLHEN